MAESDLQFPVTGDELVAPPPSGSSRLRRIGLMLSLPLILIAGAIYYYRSTENIISTDNAYLQQDKVSVSPQLTGEITEVLVHENQQVRSGDLLFRVDPEPYRIAIAQNDAAIAAAQVKVIGLETDLVTTGVDINGAREDVAFYQEEFRRQSELMQQGFTTRTRLQAAQHDVDDARSKLGKAQADASKARAALATGAASPGVNPALLAAQAQRRKALLDLSRTEVHAPVSGTITQATRLQLGQMMTVGLPALTIVVSDHSWVEANFKETDLAHMHIGQPAKLSFDAYPDLRLKGHVASIGAGTGSEFSVLPAQNANGNWVKVTQRVPVRIAIDGQPTRQLIAGLSTHVVIDTSK
jgi:membrane fusion protein (multidrug efflux system)